MVYQQIFLIETTEAIPTIGSINQHIVVSQAETHETHNDIATFDGTGITSHTDTITRCCLTGNRCIRRNVQRRLQMNGSRHIEHNSLGSILRQSPTERPIATVIQIGHMIDSSTTTSGDIASESLSSGESRKFLDLFGQSR